MNIIRMLYFVALKRPLGVVVNIRIRNTVACIRFISRVAHTHPVRQHLMRDLRRVLIIRPQRLRNNQFINRAFLVDHILQFFAQERDGSVDILLLHQNIDNPAIDFLHNRRIIAAFKHDTHTLQFALILILFIIHTDIPLLTQ